MLKDSHFFFLDALSSLNNIIIKYLTIPKTISQYSKIKKNYELKKFPLLNNKSA